MSKRLQERFAFQGGRVDRTGPNPVIRGVLLCGAVSANRRRYRKEAFAGGRVNRYADKPVYLNHGNGRDDRRYEDQLGWVRNPRHRADGMPVGDIEVKKSHPFAETFLSDAEHNPRAVGMSHVAHCTTRPATDGWEDVTEMIEAESVDIVTRPATTQGLFEHHRGTAMRIRTYLAEMIASGRTKAVRAANRVREALTATDATGDDTAVMDAPMAGDAPPADGADHEQAVDAAMESAGCAVWKSFVAGKLELDAALKKLRQIGTAHGKIQDDSNTDNADDSDGMDGQDDSSDGATESRRRKPPVGAAAFAEFISTDVGVIHVGSNAPRMTEARGTHPADPRAFATFVGK